MAFNLPASLIFDESEEGRCSHPLPQSDVPELDPEQILPPDTLREELPLPSVTEPQVVRHFARLAKRNVGIDDLFYPLGSCTMKYNPRVNELVASMPGFAALHPYQDEHDIQGALQVMHELTQYLVAITGMSYFSLQPAAGAHGELASLMMIRKALDARGEKRQVVLVPDTAHGTNPASAITCGFKVKQVPSNSKGQVDIDALRNMTDTDVGAFMLTLPNTLGLFEPDIEEIAKILHDAGAFLYGDGANLNALLGRIRPGDIGFDVMHLNLHKTFSTPHGGGGPGAGPIGVSKELEPFLPAPLVSRRGEDYALDWDRPQSIGRMRTFYGNFGMLVRAYTYIRSVGREGLREISDAAVLNANYLKAVLKDHLQFPYDAIPMHEFVAGPPPEWAEKKLSTFDLAKRLVDYGCHPMTIYFPLVVDQAIMVEPTETESKETLDHFAHSLIEILEEGKRDPDLVRTAPHRAPVSRVNVMRADSWRDFNWYKRTIRRTQLHETHMQLGAQIFVFAGWQMPLFYSSVDEEHIAVRERAGLFDISHMGEIRVEGPGAEDLISHLGTNNPNSLAPGEAQYTFLCNERGGVLDDVFLYRLDADRFLFVVNASNREKIFRWIRTQARGKPVTVLDISLKTALLALQGPSAETILSSLMAVDSLPSPRNRIVSGKIAGIPILISRTGYTGEDGFETLCDWNRSQRLWRVLLDAGKDVGLVPVGLGARNTLRIEAGFALYGHEIDEETSPLAATGKPFVKFDHEFIGREAIETQKDQPGAPRLIRLASEEEMAIPEEADVLLEGRKIGHVTSAAHLPGTGRQVGMARLANSGTKAGSTIQIQGESGLVTAEVLPLRFKKRKST